MGTILIVEDEFMIANVTRRLLENSGFEVCGIASTGEAAIEMALLHTPQLILMDVCLPGKIGGIEACRQIQQQIDCEFIVLTGNPSAEVQQQAADINPLAIIAKPYRFPQIMALIQEVVGSPCSPSTKDHDSKAK